MLSRICFVLAALALLPFAPALAQPTATAPRTTIADGPLSDRRVSYTITATLDPEARTVQGSERVTWRNPDRAPVGELQFHLYLNAFKNERSTFMRESGGKHRGFSARGTDVWGGIDVTRMAIAPPQPGDTAPPGAYSAEETDLTDRIRFIQPDDGNPDDQTVIAVTLPRPVAPGETIALDIDFTALMPKVVARTGWAETEQGHRFFMVAQWFPKLGVYEEPGVRYVPADAPHGQWNTHQFHANTEFYADFGTYRVTMTVPEAYVVGASGVRVNETTEAGARTLTYQADDVHDFAWTASPDFLEYTDTWRHVNLRLLLQPHHKAQAERHFKAVKAALDRYDAWVGEYPYTTLTLVDGIGGSNGMEYPTLITCGTTYKMPGWMRLPELVTVHEFGHQYFYGMIASNEFEEAWLDEGINSYFEARIMDDAYGPGAVVKLPYIQVSDEGMQRLMYTKNAPDRGAVFTRAWEYEDAEDYSKATYAKPATLLLTLENYLGRETTDQVFQTYYDRWRFRHPTTRDFIAVAEEVSGMDLGWFFDQYVYGVAVVDYEVASLRSSKAEPPEGTEGDWYESRVEVHRKQDGVFPQTLLVRFEDGSEERLAWDGVDAWKRFTFHKAARAAEAYLDPDNAVRLDVNRLDNRKIAGTDNTLARKEQLDLTSLLQQVFYLIAGLF